MTVQLPTAELTKLKDFRKWPRPCENAPAFAIARQPCIIFDAKAVN